MNAIQHELIARGWIDLDYIGRHTLGFDKLREVVENFPPERAAEICQVPAESIREAARLIGSAERLLSTVLQGFYQSMSATASSVQVNNIHLLRGLIGKPGCGIYQMNGQPTAQNTRETGADGDLPGFRNWDNPTHIKQLADLWKVDPMIIPHWAPPTHAMQIWRYAEQGSIKLLWISGTNPAVSLPELARIRKICQKEGLFLIVQDGFLTETAQFADVVLPAAIWGEKTGTFTNVDRTVHISDKAVDPPGEARSDLDIWLDYARRMDFRNLDGDPLIQWHDPETAFEAWKQCSRGPPLRLHRMTYGKLRGSSGIQWPCTAEAPDGTERLYTDGSSIPIPTTARPTAMTSPPARKSSRWSTRPSSRMARPSCTAPSTSPRMRSRTPTTRSPSPPAAPSTIAHPHPHRPHAAARARRALGLGRDLRRAMPTSWG